MTLWCNSLKTLILSLLIINGFTFLWSSSKSSSNFILNWRISDFVITTAAIYARVAIILIIVNNFILRPVLNNYFKGRFADCCPFCNFCEWFYGFPFWFYVLLFILFILLFAAFWTLLALVLMAPQSATTVTNTKIYNRTWFMYQLPCTPAVVGCTTYSTTLATAGYMSGQESFFLVKFLMLFFGFAFVFLSQKLNS